MKDWEFTPHEEAAFYEAGLSAHGCMCSMDEYMREGIVKYGRILLAFEREKNAAAEQKCLKLLELLDELQVRYRFIGDDRDKIQQIK